MTSSFLGITDRVNCSILTEKILNMFYFIMFSVFILVLTKYILPQGNTIIKQICTNYPIIFTISKILKKDYKRNSWISSVFTDLFSIGIRYQNLYNK